MNILICTYVYCCNIQQLVLSNGSETAPSAEVLPTAPTRSPAKAATAAGEFTAAQIEAMSVSTHAGLVRSLHQSVPPTRRVVLFGNATQSRWYKPSKAKYGRETCSEQVP